MVNILVSGYAMIVVPCIFLYLGLGLRDYSSINSIQWDSGIESSYWESSYQEHLLVCNRTLL